MVYVVCPLENKGLFSLFIFAAFDFTLIEFKIIEGHLVFALIMFNQGCGRFSLIFSLQYIDLVKEFKYKVPITSLPVKYHHDEINVSRYNSFST